MKLIISDFFDSMTKPQRIAGLIYLPLHIFILPILLRLAAYFLPGGLSLTTSNLIYYAMGFSFCLFFFWGYLRQSYDSLADHPLFNAFVVLVGFFMSILLGYLIAGPLALLLGDELANPNNEVLQGMSAQNPRAIVGLVVFMGPVVEEILFRGVIFGGLRTKSRFWAFTVSLVVFGLYHVWQLALIHLDWRILLYMLQYFPLSYALGWAYEKTGSIWAPIFLHMLNNAIAMQALA